MFVAPHGGGIEPSTELICREIAGSEFSYYLAIAPKIEGVHGPDHPFHIKSHDIEEPILHQLSVTHESIITFHSYSNEKSTVHLGGLSEELKNVLAVFLKESGFEVVLRNGRNHGVHPDNICNRGIIGRGLQIEISNMLMHELVNGGLLTERGQTFVETVRNFAIQHTEKEP